MPRHAALVLALASFAPCSPAADAIPPSVVRFLERRAVCDSWRFEPRISAERTALVAEILCIYCAGTDAELAQLKKRFSSDSRARDELAPLEERIEPGLQGGRLNCASRPGNPPRGD